MVYTRALTLLPITFSLAGDVPNHKLFADGLSKGIFKKTNECSSALGVSMCFGLVYPGASGACATQIKSTLHYPSMSTQTSLVWGPMTDRVTTKYNGKCTLMSQGRCESKKPTLEIANSIWINGGTLKSAYKSLVGSLSQSIDFKAADAAGIVNSWCRNKTRGLIPKILMDGPISGDLIAVNAIYLNASWSEPFQERNTNADAFYDSPARGTARSSQAHFMHMVSELPYVKLSDGFQLLRLPYASSALSMLVALPGGGGTLSQETTSAAVISALPAMKSTRVAVALPKFKFRSEYSAALKTTLEALGMLQPFKGGFDGMLENTELLVSKIIQKTFINVYEKGTEAAAVTAMVMEIVSAERDPPPDPILFLADHPFQFWIYDSTEEVVLFEGRVGDPGVVLGSVKKLTNLHLDKDFWSKIFGVNVVVTAPQQQQKNLSSGALPLDLSRVVALMIALLSVVSL